MTAPYFSSTGNQKSFSGFGLSSTAYTFGCKVFYSGTIGVTINQILLQATDVLAESTHIRPRITHLTAANTFLINQNYSLANSIYAFSATDNEWHSIFIVHDRGSLTPTPIVYVDRVTAVISIVSAPAGSVVMPTAGAGYTIGGRPGGVSANVFRGFVQHMVWANGLWTKAQCDQFASAPGSFMQDVQFYYPFNRPNHHDDYGGNSRTLTAVDSTSGPTSHDSTISGGIRRQKLLRVGL